MDEHATSNNIPPTTYESLEGVVDGAKRRADQIWAVKKPAECDTKTAWRCNAVETNDAKVGLAYT